MKKLKQWVVERFLPIYLRDELLKENERLRQKITEQDIHIKQLDAYICGLEYSIRKQKQIVIYSHEEGKP